MTKLATWRWLAPTVTVKSFCTGSEFVSRSSLKVSVRILPVTSALKNSGGVPSSCGSWATFWSPKVAASLPARSCNGSVAGLA